MNLITFELPWPPSVNNYKKIGKIVKTQSGKLYQQRINNNETKMFYFEVYMISKKIMPTEGSKFAISDQIELEVSIDLHPPHQKRYDVDNRLKVLLDSLTRAKIIKDDSQIRRLIVQKKPMIEHGKTIVSIRILEPENDTFSGTNAQEIIS